MAVLLSSSMLTIGELLKHAPHIGLHDMTSHLDVHWLYISVQSLALTSQCQCMNCITHGQRDAIHATYNCPWCLCNSSP